MIKIKQFQILRDNADLIEFKSKYHYWCMIPNRYYPDTYFLWHKHEQTHPYHRQFKEAFALNHLVKYVLDHDSYVESKSKISNNSHNL